ncbi:MAG: hypothetical protein WCX46_01595 [Candidatus Paceibacterota bacterium]
MKNNDIKYIFLRHGKLDLPYKDHSEMPLSVLIEVAGGKISPSIDVLFLNEKLLKLEPFLNNIDTVVTSSMKRGVETGKIIHKSIKEKRKKDIGFFIEDNLKEVSFNLEKIVDGLDYIPNISQINDLVYGAICELGERAENFDSVFNRVKEVIKKYNIDDKVVLIITHSFLLEVMEMFIKNKNNKNFIGNYDELSKTKSVFYLSGFTTDKDLNIINFINV